MLKEKGLKVNKFCDSEEFQDGELEEKEDDELGIIEMGESYIWVFEARVFFIFLGQHLFFFCKTQPPASIGWVALSSVVCRRRSSVRPSHIVTSSLISLK